MDAYAYPEGLDFIFHCGIRTKNPSFEITFKIDGTAIFESNKDSARKVFWDDCDFYKESGQKKLLDKVAEWIVANAPASFIEEITPCQKIPLLTL